jgi:DNA topoisomerase-3
MKIVLAEKPAVAADIAKVLGATKRENGYFEGNGYQVTYAFGHLVSIAEPEKMNSTWAKPWALSQLPMLPTEWKYETTDKSRAQFDCIRKLFLNSETTGVICATDAGREGEHIFRLIYQLANCNKPVQRLWISSLTAEAIRDGFNNLRPSRDFDHLAAAASARAHADWLVGLNFTRAYTIINNQICTVGRVQTPTLALIVERHNAIQAFTPTPFYEILATFDPGFVASYITPGPDLQTRLTDRAAAEAILRTVTPIAHGIVESITVTPKESKPPQLYNLLTLQKEANKRYGYTAQETLDLAQNLYEEHKILSYPRTECRHLSTDMVAELPKILSALPQQWSAQAQAAIEALNRGFKLTKSYVDDTKLTDHHAIIPTHKSATPDLPERPRNIYHLVVLRFLSIFLPPELRDETVAILNVAEHSFKARGVVIRDPGWTVLEKSPPTEDDEDHDDKDDKQQLPPLAQGQHVAKFSAELKEGKTTPPKPYDDSTLLTAMKNAGQQIDDQELAEHMKQNGLGTPATRAGIIERLIHSGYIERKKKTIIPTAKGIHLVVQVHTDLKDVALTASWEQRLADMQDGKVTVESFESDIAALIKRILPLVLSATPPIPATAVPGLGPCPLCKQGVIRMGQKSASCNRWREGCKFTIWKEQHGKQLSDSQIAELLTKRRTKIIKGFKKKDGSGSYDARLVLSDDFKVRLEFDSDPKPAKPA